MGAKVVAVLGALALLSLLGLLGVTLHDRISTAATPREAPALLTLALREVIGNADDERQVLLLEVESDGQLLLVLVGPGEAEAIRRARSGGGDERGPLLGRTVGALGATIAGALLDADSEVSLRGALLLDRRGAITVVETSAAEAVAVALGAGKPLFATPRALEENALSPDELRAAERAAEAEDEAKPGRGPALSL